MEKIYIYLTKRDKTTIKVLTVVKGNKCPPMKIKDVNDLKLPEELTDTLKQSIEENKMLWEPWIESANDFQELRNNLKKRGIKKPPMHSAPGHKPSNVEIKTNNNKSKSMLRKKD